MFISVNKRNDKPEELKQDYDQEYTCLLASDVEHAVATLRPVDW